MSALGDAFRSFAAACDRTQGLGGAIYVVSGDHSIHLACPIGGSDSDNFKMLCRTAMQAAENGGGKINPDLPAAIEEILDGNETL